MTLGPRQVARCIEVPVVVATEKEPGEDGRRGSMSMCEKHMKVFMNEQPDYATFEKIKK